MKKSLTQVVLDCLLAFYLNSAEQADNVLRANLDKVSIKNKKVLEQILMRQKHLKIKYWNALADELEHQALADDSNVEFIKPNMPYTKKGF